MVQFCPSYLTHCQINGQAFFFQSAGPQTQKKDSAQGIPTTRETWRPLWKNQSNPYQFVGQPRGEMGLEAEMFHSQMVIEQKPRLQAKVPKLL